MTTVAFVLVFPKTARFTTVVLGCFRLGCVGLCWIVLGHVSLICIGLF